MNKKLEISIILFSDGGREINFRELRSGKSYFEQKELNPEFFWGATGGFEITIDANKTIYKGFEFYVALEAIRFLLHSDEEFPHAVISRFSNQNFIKLSKIENNTLSFSYQSTENQLEVKRGNRFFLKKRFHHMNGLKQSN